MTPVHDVGLQDRPHPRPPRLDAGVPVVGQGPDDPAYDAVGTSAQRRRQPVRVHLREVLAHDPRGHLADHVELVVQPRERGGRPRVEEVGCPEAGVGEGQQQVVVEVAADVLGDPEPGQVQRVAAGVADGAQRQRELVQRGDREPDLTEVHALELVLDHEAKRYISGVGPTEVRELLRAHHILPPRAGRPRAHRGDDGHVAVDRAVLRRERALLHPHPGPLRHDRRPRADGRGRLRRGGVVRRRVGQRPGARRPDPALGDGRPGAGAAGLRVRRRHGVVRARGLLRGRPAGRGGRVPAGADRPVVHRTGPGRHPRRAPRGHQRRDRARHRGRRRDAGDRHRRGVPDHDGRRRGAGAASRRRRCSAWTGGCRS